MFVAACLLACSTTSIPQPQVFATDRGAIGGVDPVAYFDEHRAVPGSSDYSLDWNGARWLFSSERNRARFHVEPEKYAPSYGGYCAYGVASGYAVKTDPDAWTIVDGRLFLNYDVKTMQEWRADRDTLIADADENWPEVLSAGE